ncbi:MAG: hypothetical protein ABSA80_13280 [Terriglobales bacterium]|jgi:hypothetical protein
MRLFLNSIQSSIRSSVQISVHNSTGLFFFLAIALVGAYGAGVDSDPLPPSITTAPLSVDQVVDNLVRKDVARAQALRHYESTRVYHLSYRGFPGDRDAEMTVEATYDSPSTKSFRVVSQTGSKLIIDRVFKRLLESEKEAAVPEMHARTLLNRDNYDFVLIGFESSGVNSSGLNSSNKSSQYVLAVYPKVRSKYVYRGKVWVDGTDFAVTRIEAEPAQNPSFWTKKNEVHHEYMKVQDFWLPRRNESVSYIRLGGRATLTIEYNNYRVSYARESGNSAKASSSDVSAH